MMWIAVSVGLLAVAAAAGLLLYRRAGSESPATSAMTSEEWMTLGIVFTGAGAALMASIGPAMAGMMALGVIYMIIGLRMRHRQPK